MHSDRLAIGAVLVDSLRLFGAALPALTAIAAVTSTALVAISAAVIAINWGLAAGADIDPKALSLLLTGREFAVIGAGFMLALLPLSYAVGATVHLSADRHAGSDTALTKILGRIHAKGLQLFWLQWVVNILAARYSPFAAVIMWLGIAAALPVALLENLGPQAAVERLLDLAKGQWARISALVVLLTLTATVVPLAASIAIFGPASPTGLGISPIARFVMAIPMVMVALVPAQFLFVALTVTYRALTGEAPLHAGQTADVRS